MPAYVKHPDHPGTTIDIVRLQDENSLRVLPAFLLPEWMKRDSWSRREALMLLAGYDPIVTQWTETGKGFGMFPAGNVGYLDKLSESMIHAAKVSWRHPRYEEALQQFLALSNYAAGGSLDERKPPSEWIAWAHSKGFSPYWLSMLDSSATSPSDVNASLSGTESTTTIPTNKKQTAIGREIDQVIARIESGDTSVIIDQHSVMSELIKRVGSSGSCIVEIVGAGLGVIWKDTAGKNNKLTKEALKKRLQRRP